MFLLYIIYSETSFAFDCCDIRKTDFNLLIIWFFDQKIFFLKLTEFTDCSTADRNYSSPSDMRQIAAYLSAARAADILLTEDFNVCFFK